MSSGLARRVCPKCNGPLSGLVKKYCKPCRAREARERYAQDLARSRERARIKQKAKYDRDPAADRDRRRRRRYGVNAEQFAAMLRSQGGVCRICKRLDPNCVDHCHRTGRFRGVLCLKCNSGLGYFREDLELMRAAVQYLLSGGVVRLDNEAMTEDGSLETKPR
jgi:hypothetical protein